MTLVRPTPKLGLFVSGTDTGIGKTYVAKALLEAASDLGVRTIGMKPVATGYLEASSVAIELPEDVIALRAASNVSTELAWINPYRFAPPIAPHLAAAAAQVTIDLSVIQEAFWQLQRHADAIVVEGAGGVCVPLSEDLDMLDIPKFLGLPVVLVVGMRLGCLNHALLSMLAIKARGLLCLGWIANQIDSEMLYYSENRQTLECLLQKKFQIPLLAEIPHQSGSLSLSVAKRLSSIWQQLGTRSKRRKE